MYMGAASIPFNISMLLVKSELKTTAHSSQVLASEPNRPCPVGSLA